MNERKARAKTSPKRPTVRCQIDNGDDGVDEIRWPVCISIRFLLLTPSGRPVPKKIGQKSVVPHAPERFGLSKDFLAAGGFFLIFRKACRPLSGYLRWMACDMTVKSTQKILLLCFLSFGRMYLAIRPVPSFPTRGPCCAKEMKLELENSTL